MRSDIDRKLTEYVDRTPGATLSSTVNHAVEEYLEAIALENYRAWDAAAPPEERAFLDALDALDASDGDSWDDT